MNSPPNGAFLSTLDCMAEMASFTNSLLPVMSEFEISISDLLGHSGALRYLASRLEPELRFVLLWVVYLFTQESALNSSVSVMMMVYPTVFA